MMVLEVISLNPYMEMSICSSNNDIRLGKYGMYCCHGDYLIVNMKGKINHLCFVARQPSMNSRTISVFLRKWILMLYLTIITFYRFLILKMLKENHYIFAFRFTIRTLFWHQNC